MIRERQRLARIVKDVIDNSHSAGLVRGMQISMGLCQHQSVTQPLAEQASIDTRQRVDCDMPQECSKTTVCECLERISRTQELS